jgi:hypothetical protein
LWYIYTGHWVYTSIFGVHSHLYTEQLIVKKHYPCFVVWKHFWPFSCKFRALRAVWLKLKAWFFFYEKNLGQFFQVLFDIAR